MGNFKYESSYLKKKANTARSNPKAEACYSNSPRKPHWINACCIHNKRLFIPSRYDTNNYCIAKNLDKVRSRKRQFWFPFYATEKFLFHGRRKPSVLWYSDKKKRYLTRQTSYFNFYLKNGRNFNVYRKWREQSCFTPTTPLCDYCLISWNKILN